jgi:sugar transferase (PEP-CTERM system associated)
VFFLRYLSFQKFGAVILENALLIGCVLTLQLRTVSLTPESLPLFLCKAFVIAITFQLFLHLKDGYEFGTKPWEPRFIFGLGQAVLLACALLSMVHVIIPALILGSGSGRFALTLLYSSLVVAIWHFSLRMYFGVSSRRSKILIMGTGPLARALAMEIVRHREYGLTVCGFVDDDPELVGVSIVNPRVLGTSRELRRIVAENGVDRVVVELQDRRGRLPVDELLDLKMRGVGVEEATSLYERVTGKIAIKNLKPSWMLFGDGFEVSRSVLIGKQIVSFSVSLLLSVMFLPLIPFIAVLIKLDSPGPVFLRQARVGQNGKIFTLWKFRSMRNDAERDTGPVWAQAQDSRVTRVGRHLRRSRLDEAPQLFNVLRGDMTLVGPRPERPKFVEELSSTVPFYYLRHSVKPGVTGWAQINYRYGNSVEDSVEKLQYDLFYIKNVSWALDLLVILHTIKTVLVRKGS